MQQGHSFEVSPNSSEDVLEQLFNELFREYEHRLYVFAFKMLKSDAIAKDVLQDVFLKLWTIRSNISEIKNISAFLYRLTENRVIDYLRAAARDQKNMDLLSKQLFETNKHLEIGVNHLEEKEYHIIIHRAIEQLSPQRKSIYLLSRSEGRSRKEVATLLHLSPNTVRNQLLKAKEHIVSYVKKYSN